MVSYSKIKFSFLALCFTAGQVCALDQGACANYKVSGFFEKNNQGTYDFLIHRKTLSQKKIKISQNQFYKIRFYLDRKVSFVATVKEPWNGTQTDMLNIDKIQLSAIDPLAPSNDFEFISRVKCD